MTQFFLVFDLELAMEICQCITQVTFLILFLVITSFFPGHCLLLASRSKKAIIFEYNCFSFFVIICLVATFFGWLENCWILWLALSNFTRNAWTFFSSDLITVAWVFIFKLDFSRRFRARRIPATFCLFKLELELEGDRHCSLQNDDSRLTSYLLETEEAGDEAGERWETFCWESGLATFWSQAMDSGVFSLKL